MCPALEQAEVERRVLVHKLAHVVREHQAVVEAMPDIGEPCPPGSISANNLQVGAAVTSARVLCAVGTHHWQQTDRQQSVAG
jgi:hypothetical protein